MKRIIPVLVLFLFAGIARSAEEDPLERFNSFRKAVFLSPVQKSLGTGDIYLCLSGGFADRSIELIYSSGTGRVILTSIEHGAVPGDFALSEKVFTLKNRDDLSQRMKILAEKVKAAFDAKLPKHSGEGSEDGTLFCVARIESGKTVYLIRANDPAEPELKELLDSLLKENNPKNLK